MFLELIATFAAGFGGAGIVLVLNLILGGRLPGWAMPVAAGLAMLAIAVASEYSWGSRTIAGLPEGVEVIEQIDQSKWYKPWTFIVPQTTRIIAVDTDNLRTKPEAADLSLADLYLFARWQPPVQVAQLIDCRGGQRADATVEALNSPSLAHWYPATPALLDKLCS